MTSISPSQQGKDLIQQQRQMFQSFELMKETYEQSKKEALSQLQIERDAADKVWTARQRQINAELLKIRQIHDAALEQVSASTWKDKIGSDTSQSLISTGSSKIGDWRRELNQADQEIRAFLQSNKDASTLSENSKCSVYALFALGACGFLLGDILAFAKLEFSLIGGIFVALGIGILLFSSMKKDPSPKLKNAVVTLNSVVANAEHSLDKPLQNAKDSYQNELDQAQSRYKQKLENIEHLWSEQFTRIQSVFINFDQQVKASFLGRAWDDPRWKEEWSPSQSIAPATRIGTLRVHPGLPEQPSIGTERNGHLNRTQRKHRDLLPAPALDIIDGKLTSVPRLNAVPNYGDRDLPPVPALVTIPHNENILFKASGDGKDKAIAVIQSLMLRLLATQPPGKVRFTLIDPIGLGQSVSTFMQLSDHFEALVGSKAWSESSHIDQQLVDITEHMSNVIQKYLRGQYQTIDEYNEKAGEIEEPYRVLVVMGFPIKFRPEAAERLVEIATNGPKCGVTTLVMLDAAQPLPHDFNLPDLERVSTVLSWNGQRFLWHDKHYEQYQLEVDTPPPLELFNTILDQVGQRAKTTSEVRVPFERIVPPQDVWWTSDSRYGISVPLGREGATKLQYLELGKGTAQHALVVGKTGSGKTTLQHILITNLALMYSPSEVELYLIDFKTVGFTAYANTLPHARVVAVQSEREFGLSVLQGLDKELERRKGLFRTSGVQDIAQYRNARSDVQLPRILLLVDEFQEFFTQNDDITKEAELYLDRLVRQGRAFGMHVLLGSQTLAGAYTLPRSTIRQMAVRIALQCEETDSLLVLSEDNKEARLLSRPGEAIYNASNGLVGGNNRFQCAWLSDDELDDYLLRIQNFAQQPKMRKYLPTWTQRVFNGQTNADVKENTELHDVLAVSTWPSRQNKVTAWLGEPIAIKDPTSVLFRSQAGNNLIMVGQHEESARGIMITSLLSLPAQHAPDSARFYVVDFTPIDAPSPNMLEHVVQVLPHHVRLVGRRGLPLVINEIAGIVNERMDKERRFADSIYLLIYGLQRARDLRYDEDSSYSSILSDESSPPSPSKQFAAIVREGPEVGVHTLVWCDTFANASRTMDRSVLREFELRVAFQMSEQDSLEFIHSPEASKLGEFGNYRAMLFNEETQQLEKFRPYGPPDQAWLQWALQSLQKKH